MEYNFVDYETAKTTADTKNKVSAAERCFIERKLDAVYIIGRMKEEATNAEIIKRLDEIARNLEAIHWKA